MDSPIRRLTQRMASTQFYQQGIKQDADRIEPSLPLQRTLLLRILTQTLQRHRVCRNPEHTLSLLENMLAQLERALNRALDLDVLAGLLLHLACSQGQPRPEKNAWASRYIEQQFSHELSLCHQAIRTVNRALSTTLPEEEAYTLVDILCQVDIPLTKPSP